MDEKRPTKLEIPNNDPIGGDMDGMDDMDAPMPPMGSDDMGDDPGMDDPMGDDIGGAPDDMGGDPGMDDMGSPDDMGGSSEDDELMDIINSLSIEDKAAVTKYAKSMADDGSEEPEMGDDMMPESRHNFKRIIDETLNSIIDKKSDNGIKRPGKKLSSKFRDNKTNPFVSPF